MKFNTKFLYDKVLLQPIIHFGWLLPNNTISSVLKGNTIGTDNNVAVIIPVDKRNRKYLHRLHPRERRSSRNLLMHH